MIRHSRVSPTADVEWSDLTDELDRWQAAGRTATVWWRDDDAIAPSERLERMLSIAGEVPVALAVIPGPAEPRLAGWLAGCHCSKVTVLQHGWRHQNHAANGKKSEFSAARPLREAAAELTAGRARLSELFGSLALPILVPPWNRLDACFLPILSDCGIRGISRINPRAARCPGPGLIEANVHIDLVAWTGDRGFIGESAALGGVVRNLRARRMGRACADEPTGILTHHLVQDEATDGFLHRLLSATRAHAAACWLAAGQVFSSAIGDAQ